MRSRPHFKITRAAAVLLAAFAAVALAACGQESSPAHSVSTSASQPASVVTVNFGEYFYRPKTLTVHVGQSVRFVNVGKIAHTIADSTPSGDIRSVLIHPWPLEHGQSQMVTFAHAGKINYLCMFHPALMRGVINVMP